VLPFFAPCDNRDEFSWDILFNYPQTKSHKRDHKSPVTLRAILIEQYVPNMPSLDDRFDLAFHVAEGLAAFHNVGWFHKNLISSKIIIFPSDYHRLPIIIRDPYVCGFKYSRDTAGTII
jgi:hypothetical protein